MSVGGMGMGMHDDDHIPAFDENVDEFNQDMGLDQGLEQDYYGSQDMPYETLQEPSNTNSDRSSLTRLSNSNTNTNTSNASQRLSAILDEENVFNSGSGSGQYEDYAYPDNQAEIQQESELLEMQAEEKRKKRQLQLKKKKNLEKIQKNKNQKSSSNSIINQKTELTNAEIKGFLGDTEPIMRKTSRNRSTKSTSDQLKRQSYHRVYFNQEADLNLLEPDQLFDLPGCRGMCMGYGNVLYMGMGVCVCIECVGV